MQALYEIVVEKIKGIIFSGKYAPNTRLNIEEMAAVCNCSKTPVREALKRLAAEDIISYKPQKGFYVKYLTFSEYLKKYEIQELLETYMIKKMAELPQFIDYEKLYSINENIAFLARSNKLVQIGEENEKFHETLYENYYNEFIVEDLKRLFAEVKVQRNLMFYYPKFVQNVVKEHELIIDALKRSDVAAAAKVMTLHYQSGREAIMFSQKW